MRRTPFSGLGSQFSVLKTPGRGRTENRELRTEHLVVLAMLVLLAAPAFGCPVCWGNPDDPMVKSANNGVWVLLGVVAFVQIGLVSMFWSFWRHSRQQARFRESLRVIDGRPHA